MNDRPSTGRTVTVRRLLPAARDILFRAWTDPQEMAKWWGPRAWTVRRCEIDLRPGGAWGTWFETANGTERYIGGVYREVTPPIRLSFTWEPEGPNGPPERVSVVTVEFHDRSDATEIVIEHRKLASGEAVDMDVGWASTFDSLERYVSKHRVGRSPTMNN
ncbi:MAG: SRPBCC domain-containing protein [Rhodospirillales bacterium]|nr:SRPBCC domain-containing protein [Rhodospirillales bacterium]